MLLAIIAIGVVAVLGFVLALEASIKVSELTPIASPKVPDSWIWTLDLASEIPKLRQEVVGFFDNHIQAYHMKDIYPAPDHHLADEIYLLRKYVRALEKYLKIKYVSEKVEEYKRI